MAEERKQLAQNIKAERVRAGLSQEETADKLGITRRAYVNYEKGFRIEAITLYKLSRIFNCNINAFFIKITSTICGEN